MLAPTPQPVSGAQSSTEGNLTRYSSNDVPNANKTRFTGSFAQIGPPPMLATTVDVATTIMSESQP